MEWTARDRLDRDPELQRGWEIIGLMVKRRRHRIGWSQRDVSRASGLAQSAISRLETGKLSGVRFGRFARLVAAMNGLDPDAKHPPRPIWATGGWDRRSRTTFDAADVHRQESAVPGGEFVYRRPRLSRRSGLVR